MLSWSLLYIVSEWVIRIGMTPVVVRRRRPTVAMSWLLVIFFQPWVGLVVYLLVGENRLPRRRIQRRVMAVHEAPADGRLIVPERSDHPITGAAGRAYFDSLMASGVRIHLHREGLLHSKTMTVDDAFSLVGSGNFDIRSFYLNFELNLLLYGPEITAELRFLQQRYMNESVRLSHAAWEQRSMAARLGEDVAKLLSPLL